MSVCLCEMEGQGAVLLKLEVQKFSYSLSRAQELLAISFYPSGKLSSMTTQSLKTARPRERSSCGVRAKWQLCASFTKTN